MRWSDLDTDPSGERARALRAVRLERAVRAAPLTSRLETATSLARGRRVIDLGCVGHSVDRIGRPGWLHALVAEAAEVCLGIDIHEPGIERMNELGFDAIVHDITGDPAPITSRGRFDVVICGEIIEHIEDLGVLFRFAGSVLEPGGVMLVTTPNPYAPWRVRAGQLGLVAENCDHICLVHPSGMAELCDRMDLRLDAAWSTEWKAASPATLQQSIRAWGAALRDRWRARFAFRSRASGARQHAPSSDPRNSLSWTWLSPLDLVSIRRRQRHHWLCESAIYIVRMTGPYEPSDDELDSYSQWTGRLH